MHNLVTQASKQYSRLIISEVDVCVAFSCLMKNMLCFIAFINILDLNGPQQKIVRVDG